MKKHTLLLTLLLLFAAGCQFTGNQNDSQSPSPTVAIDTVFASPADSLEYVLNHISMNPIERLKVYEQLCWYFG